ncbi:hypothetical protein AB3S75_026525 [Citrus x aurantiifolia]
MYVATRGLYLMKPPLLLFPLILKKMWNNYLRFIEGWMIMS